MADFDLDSVFVPALYKPPELLPIAQHRDAILYLIETYQVLIVIGETGSGKTTQIPQFLEKAGWCSDGKMIGITQVLSLGLKGILNQRTDNISASACSRDHNRNTRGRRTQLRSWKGGGLRNSVRGCDVRIDAD
jgi:ATP-dependent RNA helicase DDX35